MAISLDLDSFFSPESTTELTINGTEVDVIAGRTQQKRSEFDGALVETRELLVQSVDFPDLFLGEEMDVAGIAWEIDEIIDAAAGCISVRLIRYLS